MNKNVNVQINNGIDTVQACDYVKEEFQKFLDSPKASVDYFSLFALMQSAEKVLNHKTLDTCVREVLGEPIFDDAAKEDAVAKIIVFLKESEWFDNMSIYWNGKCLRINDEGSEPKTISGGVYPSQLFEHVNDDTITIIFEASCFWDIYNGTYGWESRNAFDTFIKELLKPWDGYFEDVFSWCITLCV